MLFISRSGLLIPQANIQSVGPSRGGGDHDAEPFVLMSTVYRENIQEHNGLRHHTETIMEQ